MKPKKCLVCKNIAIQDSAYCGYCEELLEKETFFDLSFSRSTHDARCKICKVENGSLVARKKNKPEQWEFLILKAVLPNTHFGSYAKVNTVTKLCQYCNLTYKEKK